MVDPILEAEAKSTETVRSGPRTLKSGRLDCCVHLKAHRIRYAAAKRLVDIIGAVILLTLLAPFFVIIAIAVAATSPGPIFYKSTRIGLCGQRFAFIKFRSMRVDADKVLEDLKAKNEKDGPIFKIKNDPRITPVGRFLRKFSLDELPQFISVLTGEMSLVGPRPPIPAEVEQYDAQTLERLTIKPGITCYWQIMGRSNLTFDEWMELDRRYIQEMSFWTDISIMLKTPAAVLRGDGAY